MIHTYNKQQVSGNLWLQQLVDFLSKILLKLKPVFRNKKKVKVLI